MKTIKDFWNELNQLEPSSELGGICADKRGYHNTIERLIARGWNRDYSYRLTADRQGSRKVCSALDWTFPEAHSGNYKRISIYTARLIRAGRNRDPRAFGLREAYGNADNDTVVEGWDFVYDTPASSDKSHLWHIHLSFLRKYATDPKALDGVLSILKGESLASWLVRWGLKSATKPKPPVPAIFLSDTQTKAVIMSLAVLAPNGNNPAHMVRRFQSLANGIYGAKLDVDGDYGAKSVAFAKKQQTQWKLPVTGVWGPKEWSLMIAARNVL